MTSLFRRFISISTTRSVPRVIKINGTCSVQMDTSDPLVVKFSLELRQKWSDQAREESRSDVCYHPPSSDTRYLLHPAISLPPSTNHTTEYDMMSALSQLMKDNKD
ncbi:MAG: hypothetical protein PHG66_06515 [Candidatus Colwellbacteria bacterium]|nr:hypothetical protein [Candidatus Colwellbacteria bacterium]